jgi:DNA-binding SARP family transcriptional activator/predicted ATPase
MTPELSNPLLKFSLLGPPRIFANDAEIFITRSTVRAMAYYLACQDKPTSRADLQLMFWPDASTSKSTTALRETLSKLRGSLPDKSFLITTPTHVYFDSNFVGCDVLDFLQQYMNLAPQVQSIPLRSALPEKLAHEYEQALALWTGRTFLNTAKLPSTEMFDDWLTQFGNQLEINRNILLERMVFHCLSIGDFNKAIQNVDFLVDRFNFNVSFHYQLFDYMIDSQQYGMANNYVSYLRPIAEQTGLVLETTILNQFIQVLMNPMVQPASEREQDWLRQFAYQLPYVGNADIMASVQSHLGNVAGIMLIGQTGIGKSRTAYEIVRRFLQSHQLVHIEIQPMMINMPNALIRQLLRQLQQPHEFANLPERQKEFLTPLFPELGQSSAKIPIYANIPPNEKMLRLMETIQWLFCQHLSTEKFCIVLDDIQYADFTSLGIIEYLIDHQVFPAHGYMLMTGDKNLFSDWKKELVKQLSSSLPAFDLQPLTVDEWEQLANSTSDANLDRSVLEIIHKQSEKNTLLSLMSLKETSAQSSTQDGKASPALTTALSFPNWFQEKFKQLSPTAQALLKYCAILDSPILQNHLLGVIAEPFETILDGLDELETHHLLLPIREPGHDLSYQFSHTLVREKVIENLSQAKKQRLHLAIAKGLADLYEPNIAPYAAVVASHYRQAGHTWLTFVHYEIAARHAAHMLAPADSNHFFEEAMQIIEKDMALISDGTLVRFFNDWVRINLQFNMEEEAKNHSSYLIRIGQERDSTYLRGAGWLNLGRAESVLSIPNASAMETINHALKLLQSIPPTLDLIRGKILKANYFARNNQFELATSLCEEILSTANPDPERATDYRYFINITKYILATIYAMQANLAIADQLFEQFYTKENLIDSAFTDIEYRNWHLKVLFDTGQVVKALNSMKLVRTDAEALGNEPMLAQVYANLAGIYHQIGWNDRALVLITEGIPYAEKYNLTHLLVDFWITLGDIHLTWGDTTSASKFSQNAMQAAKTDDKPTTLNKAAIYVALMEGRNGNIEKAVRMIKAIMGVLQNTGNISLFLQTQRQLFQLCASEVKGNDYCGIARDEIAFFLQETKQKRLALCAARAHLLLAHYDFRQGSHSNALREVHTAINLFQKFELHIDELNAYRLLSQYPGLTADDQTRVHSLLNHLEKNNQHESIRASAQGYLAEIKNTIFPR